jgi:hypothetical protein
VAGKHVNDTRVIAGQQPATTVEESMEVVFCIFIRDKPTLSSERMLHKDYDSKGSVAKIKTLAMSLKRLGAKVN